MTTNTNAIACSRCHAEIIFNAGDLRRKLTSATPTIRLGKVPGSVMHTDTKCGTYNTDKGRATTQANKAVLTAWGIKMLSTKASENHAYPDTLIGGRLEYGTPKSEPSKAAPKASPKPSKASTETDPVLVWAREQGATTDDVKLIQASRSGAVPAHIVKASLSSDALAPCLDASWSVPKPAQAELLPETGKVHDLDGDTLRAMCIVVAMSEQPLFGHVVATINGKSFRIPVKLPSTIVGNVLDAS